MTRSRPDPAPDHPTEAVEASAEELVVAVGEILDLAGGERLEGAYVFEPVERARVAFTLALVTVDVGDGRLEMVAIGGRSGGPDAAAREFVRRARFPVARLDEFLVEFIDRCGVEGAAYERLDLAGEDDPVAALAAALAPGPA